MLNPNLLTPLQVIHKLEREMHRSFHHKNYIHKSDHFYNFCITALSLKDYILNYLKITIRNEKQPYYEEWAKIKCLKAATEIANTTKHCTLEKYQKTQSLTKTTTIVVHVTVYGNRDTTEIEENAVDYKITLSDGRELHIYDFTMEVINYWKSYLSKIGIEYIAQDKDTFYGNPEA